MSNKVIKKQIYNSSTTVKSLLENNRFSFWKKDWSERIIVQWDPNIKRTSFFEDIKRQIGPGFIFERAINNEPTQFIATKNGLQEVKVENKLPKTILELQKNVTLYEEFLRQKQKFGVTFKNFISNL